jgi:hypothetical protein
VSGKGRKVTRIRFLDEDGNHVGETVHRSPGRGPSLASVTQGVLARCYCPAGHLAALVVAHEEHPRIVVALGDGPTAVLALTQNGFRGLIEAGGESGLLAGSSVARWPYLVCPSCLERLAIDAESAHHAVAKSVADPRDRCAKFSAAMR